MNQPTAPDPTLRERLIAEAAEWGYHLDTFTGDRNGNVETSRDAIAETVAMLREAANALTRAAEREREALAAILNIPRPLSKDDGWNAFHRAQDIAARALAAASPVESEP